MFSLEPSFSGRVLMQLESDLLRTRAKCLMFDFFAGARLPERRAERMPFWCVANLVKAAGVLLKFVFFF